MCEAFFMSWYVHLFDYKEDIKALEWNDRLFQRECSRPDLSPAARCDNRAESGGVVIVPEMTIAVHMD